MPRIARSAESGDIHSHVFVCLLPKDSLANPAIPNSCDGCHFLRGEGLEYLQAAWDALVKLPVPVSGPLKLAFPPPEAPTPEAPEETSKKGKPAKESPKK
jgi:hypothetical protein